MLTTREVELKLQDYDSKKENGYAHTKRWRVGYVCALRDMERITHQQWHKLVDFARDTSNFKNWKEQK